MWVEESEAKESFLLFYLHIKRAQKCLGRVYLLINGWLSEFLMWKLLNKFKFPSLFWAVLVSRLNWTKAIKRYNPSIFWRNIINHFENLHFLLTPFINRLPTRTTHVLLTFTCHVA